MLYRKKFRADQSENFFESPLRAKWDAKFLGAIIAAFMIHAISMESIAGESKNSQEQEKDSKTTNEKTKNNKNASEHRNPFRKIQDCKTTKDCIYSNTNEFTCNQNKIVITSTCVTKDEFNSDPYCFMQNVAFINSTSNQANSISYYYKNDSQKFVNNARCIESKNKFYVELESGNMGNCKICEWSDYFSESGRYLGSEQGLSGKTSFSKRLLRQKELQPIKDGRLLQSVEITTISN
jgi:hypothetical protein